VQLFADYLNLPLGLFAEQEAPSHCENVFVLQWLLQRSSPSEPCPRIVGNAVQRLDDGAKIFTRCETRHRPAPLALHD
jgi:hypothetical protein